MSRRVEVTAGCTPRCPSCAACRPGAAQAPLEPLLALEDDELVLGGGDATSWTHLGEVLRQASGRRRIWVEAPARAFFRDALRALAQAGAHGVVVQIEGAGEQMLQALGVGDGERALADAAALGLGTQARLCVRPKTLPALAALAGRIAPCQTWLELWRQDWGGEPVPIWPGPIERLLLAAPHVFFSGHRMVDRGYLPPCVLPTVWAVRPTAWHSLHSSLAPTPNRTLEACASCALAPRCQFADAGALAPEVRADATPLGAQVLPWERHRSDERDVPPAIVRRRPAPEVACVTPWTTVEIVDPVGEVRQCCSTWTLGHRGSVQGSSIAEVWNGPGYQEARRVMASGKLEPLCAPICSRLHDRRFSERRLRIQAGSEPFVQNQLLLAEELAERREVLRARPLRMALCPSTYCNYNCIMCSYGRTPRRELPAHVWDELPEYLPTLRSLTLLGGEPLASPQVQRLLLDFDSARWPDVSVDMVTNGSLLTESILARMGRCTLGDITVSLNAGTPEVYERVQRGILLDQVLRNVDALLRYRDTRPRWFGVTLSFVVQPAASHTLPEFAELALARSLPIRLMALNPEDHQGLDFYADPEQVTRVLGDLDRFIESARRVRPDWVGEALAARAAVEGEARSRQAGPGASRPRRDDRAVSP